MSAPLTTARISGRSLTVLARPFTATEAFEAMDDDGTLCAVIKVPVDHMVGPYIEYDVFYDRLAAALVDDFPPYLGEYMLHGVDDGGHYLFVEVTFSIGSMLEGEGAGAGFLAGIDPKVVAAAVARITIPYDPDAAFC